MASATSSLRYSFDQAFVGLNAQGVELTCNVPLSPHPIDLASLNLDDAGVALWWRTHLGQHCLPVDKFHHIVGNLKSLRLLLDQLVFVRQTSPELFDRVCQDLLYD